MRNTTHLARLLTITLVASSNFIFAISNAHAQHRQFASVPPTLELEVLDPGVDPNGNPRVVVNDDGTVDIPPTVIVHRYYYSGDRSFQGPMLPGGPSILVMNHPKTGQKTYVSAQMMPGAPRVTYTKNRIVFQYPKHATIVEFGWGAPKVKYRNGLTMSQKVSKTLRLEELQQSFESSRQKFREASERRKLIATGVAAQAVQGAKVVTLPFQNIAQTLPFGKKIFSGELGTYYAEKGALFQRDWKNEHAERRAKIDDLTIPTNR